MVGAIAIAIAVAAAGLTIYVETLPRSSHGPFPTIWSIGRTNCPQCGPGSTLVAADPADLYVLQQGNISLYGNVSFELNAYNWSTGREAWAPSSIDVGAGVLGRFLQAQDGYAELVSDGSALVMVTFGTWVEAGGQLLGAGTTPCGPVGWVVEWNGTTGQFLGAQHTACTSGFGFASLNVAEADGWIGIAITISGNFTVATFPVEGSSSAYRQWNVTVNTTEAAPGIFVEPALTMGAGLVSFLLMGDTNLAAVLSGSSGAVVWEGTLPDLYTITGNATFSYLPTVVGEFSNVVLAGDTFYYIANETGSTELNAFDFGTNATVTLASLPGRIHPIDSQLSLLGGRTLVVTDAAGEHYWAFSTGGAALWNLTLPLQQVATNGMTGVAGVDFTPFPLTGNYSLVACMWASDFADYMGTDYPTVTYRVPLAVVDWATGQEAWSASYTETMTIPSPNYPVTYWPLLTEGRFAAVEYYPGNGLGWSLSIAEFPALPS